VARRVLLAAAALLIVAGARAQLVPITRCNAAIPCNFPYGLRPWRAANWTPDTNSASPSAAISVFSPIDQGLKPQIVTQPVAEDASEQAARIYLRHYPPPVAKATPVPTPALTPRPTPAGN
jgi:hypothetical protein